jgi:hypothetical protein
VMFEFHKLINYQRGRLLPAAADSAKAARVLSLRPSQAQATPLQHVQSQL